MHNRSWIASKPPPNALVLCARRRWYGNCIAQYSHGHFMRLQAKANLKTAAGGLSGRPWLRLHGPSGHYVGPPGH